MYSPPTTEEGEALGTAATRNPKTARSTPESFARRLGRRISRLRRCARPILSQEDLARRIGVSRSYVAKIESGEGDPTLALAKRIAEVLRVPIAELVREDHGDPCLERWHETGLRTCRVFNRLGISPTDAEPIVDWIAKLIVLCVARTGRIS